MVHFIGGLLLFTALSLAAPSEHKNRLEENIQRILGSPSHESTQNPRKLHGKFLHITDIHPDPYYKIGTSADDGHPCHQGEGVDNTGYYGAPVTDCDSPFTLISATFKWIAQNIRDDIDFVVWTGDSARHDNDEDIPRTNRQVEYLNEFVVEKFVETFGKPDNINDPDPTNDFVVPIIPTFGNNDMLPHNIFYPGPNDWTRRYLDIWRSFIPEAQRHSFARGGWFFTEVIPNKLAVISLNTMYFFDSNSATDGCDLKSEPGYEHMEWLRIQLQFMRLRNMKAILIGHVPPARTESKQSWDETCYQKYTLWLRQYRDVIVGNIYGHMNIDHFMFQDVKDLNYKFKIKGVDNKSTKPKEYSPHPRSNDGFYLMGKTSYLNELREGWSDLPTPPKGISYHPALADHPVNTNKKDKKDKKQSKLDKKRDKFLKEIGGPWAERYSVSLVSPSVVPNYFPTLRIIEYNITGLEHDHPAIGVPKGISAEEADLFRRQSIAPEHTDHILEISDDQETDQTLKKRKKKKGKKKPVKPPFPVPKPPSSTTPPGPAYSPQTFTWLSFTQLYANLTEIHERMTQDSQVRLDEDTGSQLLKRRKKDRFEYKVEYSTNNDSFYHLPELTVRSWLELAEKIGRSKYSRPDMLSMLTLPHNLSEVDQIKDDYSITEELEVRKKKKGDSKKDRNDLTENRLWHAFVKRVFVQALSDDQLEEDFG